MTQQHGQPQLDELVQSEVDDPCSIYMSSLKRRIGVFEVI